MLLFRSHSHESVLFAKDSLTYKMAVRSQFPQTPGKYGRIHFIKYSQLLDALCLFSKVPFMFLPPKYESEATADGSEGTKYESDNKNDDGTKGISSEATADGSRAPRMSLTT